MRFALLAAAAVLLPVPTGVTAQPREYSVEEIAGDLAYGFCPLFLAGSFPLDSPQLAERGFAPAVQTQQNARFGPVATVTAKRADGEITFGGVAGKFCTVVVAGGRRTEALARLREAMSWSGLDFKPAAQKGPTLPGVAAETFKAPVEGQMLNLQLVQLSGPTPAVTAQLFVTAD